MTGHSEGSLNCYPALSWVISVAFIAIESALFLSINIPVIHNIFIYLAMIFFEFVPFVLLIFCFTCMLKVA